MRELQFYQSQFTSDHKIIHMNNAGLSPISKPAADRIRYWAERFFAEGFYTDHDYMKDVAFSRLKLSELIGCESEEIAFFQNTSNAVSQICFHLSLYKDDQVITWDQEYGSHLYPWQQACVKTGAHLISIESDPDFHTPVEKILNRITDKTKAIAISWVQFQTGARTDVKKLAAVTREKGIFLFVDVMQGLGLHPFEMKTWGVDAVAGGSHKWLTSPVGAGFLALDKKHIPKITPHNIGANTFGTCDDPVNLVCQPKLNALKFESGSKQVLEITALGASVELILKTGVTVIEKEILRLSNKLANGLNDLGYKVLHDNSSIVNFVPHKNSAEKLKILPCNFALRGPGIRLSPHAFNTDEQIERILQVLRFS